MVYKQNCSCNSRSFNWIAKCINVNKDKQWFIPTSTFLVTNWLLRKWNIKIQKTFFIWNQIQYKYQYDVFLHNKQFCTFLFSVPMGVLSLWETGGTSRILKPSYRCCIGGAVTWRLQRGTAAIKWALLSVPWRCVEFNLR